MDQIKSCRISSKTITPILHLGDQPLANSLKKNPLDKEKLFPLSISFCEQSSLLQLNETINKDLLFKDYIWVTSTSKSTLKYSETFFKNVIEVCNLDYNDLILEIASNDGAFLKTFNKNGFNNTLGIDPAINIAEIANNDGIKTLPKFWNTKTASEINKSFGRAKLVFARNVIPHVSELKEVVQGIYDILDDDGFGVIEYHDAGTILKELHYDSIYHEHLCYFSLNSIKYLLDEFNLKPFHIENSPISGGSKVIFFTKKFRNITRNFHELVKHEIDTGVNTIDAWKLFAKKCHLHKKETMDILKMSSSSKVIGFGSSARSQTYLNYCGINQTHISAIIDNNTLKQGLYSPGSNIPIVNFNDGLKLDPDIIFILAWNFKDEIISQCKESGYKGKFLIPFPNKVLKLDQ